MDPKTLTLSLILATNFLSETNFAERELKKLIGVFDFLKKAVSNFGGALTSTLKVASVGIALFTADFTAKLIGLNRNIALSSFRYIQIRHDIDGYKKALYDIALQSDLAIDVIDEMNKKLFDAGLKGAYSAKQVSELGASITKFSYVTGVGIEEVTSMSAALSRWGIDNNAVLETLFSLNRTLPLTKQEMSELLNIIKELSANFVLFSDNTQYAIESMTRLAGSFLSLGAKGSDVSNFIESISDPAAYFDSAKGLMMMGIGMNDLSNAMAGTTNPADMIMRMRTNLDAMKTSGPFMFSYMIKQMGISKDFAATILKYNDKQLQQIRDQYSAQKNIADTWKDAKEAYMDLHYQWTKFVNALLTALGPMADKITIGLKKAYGWLDMATTGLKNLKMGFGTFAAIVTAIFIGTFMAVKMGISKIGSTFAAETNAMIGGLQTSVTGLNSSLAITLGEIKAIIIEMKAMMAMQGGIAPTLIGGTAGMGLGPPGMSHGMGKLPAEVVPEVAGGLGIGASILASFKAFGANIMKGLNLKAVGGYAIKGIKSSILFAIIGEMFNIANDWGKTDDKFKVIGRALLRIAIVGIAGALGAALVGLATGGAGTGIGGIIGGILGSVIASKLLPPLEATAESTKKTAEASESKAGTGTIAPNMGRFYIDNWDKLFSTSYAEVQARHEQINWLQRIHSATASTAMSNKELEVYEQRNNTVRGYRSITDPDKKGS